MSGEEEVCQTALCGCVCTCLSLHQAITQDPEDDFANLAVFIRNVNKD